MSGIFGNSAEDRHHAAELDNYLESGNEEELCDACLGHFEAPEIVSCESGEYCQPCYDSLTEEEK